MKKGLKRTFYSVMGLILAAAIFALVYAAFSWYKLDDMELPVEKVLVNGQESTQIQTQWTVPVFFGLLEREFYNEDDKTEVVAAVAPVVDIEVPVGYENFIKITQESETVFEGDISGYKDFSFLKNGSYDVEITLVKPALDTDEYGRLSYKTSLNVDIPPPEPTMSVSANSVVQGDTLLIELENVPEGETPKAQTDLSLTTFMPLGEGHWIAYTGVADARDPGEYEVMVTFKDFEKKIPITVTQGDFKRQDLWIDTSNPSISEANSDYAYQQFREAIRPLYETADSTLYWDGNFIQPVDGRLSSEYGLLRYTNGGKTPRRHSGIDIAAPSNTPIQAPANGRVVFSDYLLNTGNTMVIEHGGGLKTYYFHMTERTVEKDRVVKAGDPIGTVGTTGYSTGPHLHFEVRIGSQNLDPFKFFNGTGGCFVINDK